MNFLHNLNVRTKLTILIILMLAGLVAVGAVGYYYLRQSENSLSTMYNKHLVTIEHLSDVRTQSRANLANLLKLILMSDPADQKTVLTDINTRTATLAADLKANADLGLDADEQTQYAALEKKMATWDSLVNQSTDLSTSGSTQEALALFKQSGDKTFEDLQSTIKDLENGEIKQAGQEYQAMGAAEKTAETLVLTIIIAAALICTALGIIITRTITNPVARIVALMRKTSEYDLAHDHSFDHMLKYKDEMGVIARSVTDLRTALREMAGKILSISSELASHSEELTATTEENAKTVNQVVAAINEMAQGSSSQAEAVAKTGQTISGIAENIGEVDSITAESAGHAIESLEVVAEGQRAVQMTAEKMRDNITVSIEVGSSITELSEVIGQVSNITEVINSIAEQTNLLALNAAIEAARAGEAGRGFAVVAEEIRKLAEGSSAAATEIANIVKDVVEKNRAAAENMDKAKGIIAEQEEAVETTQKAFKHIESSVHDISERTQNAANMLGSIAAASKEILTQTENMETIAEEAAAGTQQISASSQEQLASIEMIAKAAGELSGMAVDLNNEISKFKI